VITVIDDMPAGVIGFRASGKVTDQDYEQVLLPALAPALEAGDVRLLCVLDEGFSYAPGAMWADARAWLKNPTGWGRIAIVSDADWLENSIKAFGWMMPGKVRAFESDDVDDAKEWLLGLDDD
jgi:hypothetical protein